MMVPVRSAPCWQWTKTGFVPVSMIESTFATCSSVGRPIPHIGTFGISDAHVPRFCFQPQRGVPDGIKWKGVPFGYSITATKDARDEKPGAVPHWHKFCAK